MNENAEKAFAELQSLMKAMEEKENKRIRFERSLFFKAIPEDTKRLYIHLSHKISEDHPYVKELSQRVGLENTLVTSAPAKSGQSFYNDHLDAIAHEQKTS